MKNINNIHISNPGIMNRTFTLLFIFFFTAIIAGAQEPQKSYELKGTVTGTKKYVARDCITLKPGFKYTASGSNTFTAKIDQCLLFPPTDATYGAPDGTAGPTSSSGSLVGKIPGTFDVSSSGAATYTIPIEVPRGINGMEPHLKIVYNSQARFGLLGYKCELLGVSSIQRIRHNYYYDGDNDPIAFNGDDRYELDGKRLISIGSSQYKTAPDNYSKIEAQGKDGNGPQWFKVTQKDGLIYEYGKTENSRMVLNSKKGVYRWLVTRIVDPNGNYISYTYDEEWIKQISYTLNEASKNTSIYTINFEYNKEKKTFPTFVDIQGGYISHNAFLEKIKIKQGNTLLNQYSIAYNEEEKSKIKSITYSNGEEDKFYPLSFLWEDNLDLSYPQTGIIGGTRPIAGNFLNEGRTEIMCLSWNSIYICSLSKYKDWSYRVSKKITEDEWYWKKYDDINFKEVADINGDGHDEALFLMKKKNDLKLFIYNYQLKALDSIALKVNSDKKQYMFTSGDYDGDMIDEFLFIFQNSEGKKKAFIYDTETSFQELDFPDLNNFDFDDLMQLLTGDFNGDGRSDLFLSTKDYYNIYKIENKSIKKVAKSLGIHNTEKSYYGWTIGDFNNDGTTDVLYIGGGDAIMCYRNFKETGMGSFYSKYQGENIAGGIYDLYSEIKIRYYRYKSLNYDINGDGLLDIVLMQQPIYFVTVPSPKVKEFEAKIDRFTDDLVGDYKKTKISGGNYVYTFRYLWFMEAIIQKKTIRTNTSTYFKPDKIYEFKKYKKPASEGNKLLQFGDEGTDFLCGDFLGNGSTSINLIYSKSIGHGIAYIFSTMTFGSIKRNNYITKIKTFEGNYSINYGALLHNSGEIEPTNYTKANDAVFPVNDFSGPLYCVKDIVYPDGKKDAYEYNGAKLHMKGKGFLGFTSTKVSSYYTKDETSPFRIIESKNTLNSKYWFMYPASTTTKVDESKLIENTGYSFGVDEQDNFRFRLLLSSQYTKNNLTNVINLIDYNKFDAYGNPENIKTNYYYQSNKPSLTEMKTITYTNAGSWCKNKPETVTITRSTEKDKEVRTTKYAYDSNGNLTKETHDAGDKNELVTTYTGYDTFGNPKTVTTTANGKSRSTTFKYTASGRFVKTKTNDFTGFTTTYKYDETTGLLSSVKDHLGLSTEYKYDGFGRQTQVKYPDGTYSVKALQWAGGDGPDKAAYYSFEKTTGGSPVSTWYDRLGRELRKEYYGFHDNKKIWIDTDYKKGKIETVSKPYFANGDKESAESYKYDDYGRIETKTTPMGITTMTYDGLTTKYSSPRGNKEVTLNFLGQTDKSTVDGNSVQFTYYPSGKLKTATPQDGKAVKLFYDKQGNRTKIIDPDAGTIESGYNGFGELTSEKYTMGSGDNKRTVTNSYTYDGAGRLDVIDQNGVTIDYIYNNYGFLGSIKKPNHEVVYTYDQGSNKHLGRLTTTTEKIDGKSFAFHATYDAFGREKKRTYPSGFYVTNSYTKYGQLEEVTGSNGKSLWKGKTANALGQFATTQKGKKTTTFGYDKKDRLESIYSPDIIDHFYIFKDNGDMKSREDRLAGQLESFTYDKHQLKTWKVEPEYESWKTYSMSYGGKTGNILRKSDVWFNMQYKDTRPHAISGITGNSSLISDEEQTITYTDFKKIATIKEGNNSLELKYGVDNQRRKAIFKTKNETTLTRYYLGDYEEELTADGETRKIHYLSGGNGLAAILVEENGSDNLYYAYTDHLGSLTALTDLDGNVKERQAFDPWGNRRDPDDWREMITTPVSHITGRGYTMHEHLDNFALINMNGRMYDPQIARFLSPDPELQAPGYWLNYNRYTYCFNNPLIYYDPTGRKTWFGKFFNWVGEGVDNATDWFWDTTYQFGSYLNDKGIYPNINVGYNTSQNFFIEGGNYRYYLNQGKTNPKANVNKEIYTAMKYEELIPYTDMTSKSSNGWYFGVSFDRRTSSILFENRTAAYDYMWENSFSESGAPIREVSGWELEDGNTIVMPHSQNGIDYSVNNYLKVKRINNALKVKFANHWYPILTHVHTHPRVFLSPDFYNPGLSIPRKDKMGSDLDMNKIMGRSIHVLYNHQVIEAHFMGNWNILNHWSW
jgi:RHS repeat-associated protein